MSLAYHRRLRFMQPLYVQAWLAIKSAWTLTMQRLADRIGDKP